MDELIQKHLQKFGENNLFRSSLDHFRETGNASGSFRESLHSLLSDFAAQSVREYKEKLKETMQQEHGHKSNSVFFIDLIDKV